MFIGHQKNNPNPFPNTMNALLTTKNDHERIPNGERPLTFLFLRRSGGDKIFANCDDLGGFIACTVGKI